MIQITEVMCKLGDNVEVPILYDGMDDTVYFPCETNDINEIEYGTTILVHPTSRELYIECSSEDMDFKEKQLMEQFIMDVKLEGKKQLRENMPAAIHVGPIMWSL